MEEQQALVAAKGGDVATLERQLEAGTLGPGVADTLGAGLVHHAARGGHLDCVRFLVQRAKLPGNQRAQNGATPAHDAAATGHLAELCWLIRDGGCGLQVSRSPAGGARARPKGGALGTLGLEALGFWLLTSGVRLCPFPPCPQNTAQCPGKSPNVLSCLHHSLREAIRLFVPNYPPQPGAPGRGYGVSNWA